LLSPSAGPGDAHGSVRRCLPGNFDGGRLGQDAARLDHVPVGVRNDYLADPQELLDAADVGGRDAGREVHLDLHDALLQGLHEQPRHLEPRNAVAAADLHLGPVLQVVLAADARQKLFMGKLAHAGRLSHFLII
jgi:hypothetical protein